MESAAGKAAAYGKSFVNNFYILLRMAGTYDAANDAVVNAANRLLADITKLFDEAGEFTVKVIGGSFYIEGIRIKAGVSEIESFANLAEELRRRSIGTLDFVSPLAADDLIKLTYAIKAGEAGSAIQAILERGMIRSIAVGGPVELREEEGLDLKDREAVARRAYTKAVQAMIEMDGAIKTGKRVKLKRIKRALQLIVDCVLLDETHLISCMVSGRHNNYYYLHPVNVAIISVLLGRRLGFNRISLRSLAMAAFFHDAGKVEIPLSILNKEGDFTPAEQTLIRRHPFDGIRVLLKFFGLNETSIVALLVAFEHHMKKDMSGYPRIGGFRTLHLFSRVVGVADDFDSLVSGKVYTRKKLSRQKALEAIAAEDGRYDPVIVKALADVLR